MAPGLLLAALAPGAAHAGSHLTGLPTDQLSAISTSADRSWTADLRLAAAALSAGRPPAVGLPANRHRAADPPANRHPAAGLTANWHPATGLTANRRPTAGLPANRRPAAGLAADRPTAAELDEHITAAARQLEVLVEQYNDARDELTTTGVQTRQLGSRLVPMVADLAERREVLSGLAWRTYQRTRSGPTIALFGAREPQDFVAKLLVLHELAAGERRAVAELRAARTRVDETRRTLNALAGRQRRLQVQLSTRKASVTGEIEALKQMRMLAYGGGSRYLGGADLPVPEYVAGPAGRVVEFAFRQVGKPYRWGAAGPHSYDCSGLALAAWQQAGVGLPHNAARQYGSTVHVNRADLRPGDLVFFYGPISHVGVYIGNGKMIHAPEFGENVRVASIDAQPIHGFGRPG
ncbi:hypothetical protein DMB66_29160 [Actinoplanes sp. ATCC 53533]|uniref:C40 family peptidase n=1 Tax=Actinoplanes sp. ATCC 53533 TaxID=1288362 RepID=UPI000F7A7194|nr:C40 family peptidase [Actinoplanes sp. ATCC 53533]RSM58491.1 hypothetical protein DMB66_29160 [Actinoplanes sp. ATCC 53533]